MSNLPRASAQHLSDSWPGSHVTGSSPPCPQAVKNILSDAWITLPTCCHRVLTECVCVTSGRTKTSSPQICSSSPVSCVDAVRTVTTSWVEVMRLWPPPLDSCCWFLMSFRLTASPLCSLTCSHVNTLTSASSFLCTSNYLISSPILIFFYR